MALQGQVSQLIAGFVFLGFFGGCHPPTPRKIAVTCVTGASMSPTIWGESVELSCPACAIRWRANWQPALRPQQPFPCWNCGHSLDPTRLDKSSGLASEAGQQITIDGDAYLISAPQINDIVAIGNSESLRIKRIIATPGDVIATQHEVLYRNDRPVVSDAPWLPVHDDRYRDQNESWWGFDESMKTHQGEKTIDGFRIAVMPSKGAKKPESPLPPARLIYQHRSPYNRLRPEPVGDDYPANLNERRALTPVDNLGLSVLLEVSKVTELQFWLWKSTGPRCEKYRLQPGTQTLQIRWRESEPTAVQVRSAPTSLGMHQSICIEVLEGTLLIRNLKVERPILYTIDMHRSEVIKLPITLQPDQYFVVGDNVPLSVDSRYEGPIHRSEIMGRVSAGPPPGH